MEQELIDIIKSLNITYKKIENPKSMEIVYNLFKNKIFDDAVTYDDPIIHLYAGDYHEHQKEYDLMKKYYLLAIEKNNTDAMNNLGLYYQEQKESDLMKKYLLMAIESGNSTAMFNLGFYYDEQKEYELMKKYYIMAIETGDSTAMVNLGLYYKEQKEYDLMKKYYMMAIEAGDSDAMYNLGYYYFYIENKLGIAIKYLRIAKENGHDKAQYILDEINNKFDI
jgi:TPR repeat protein